MTVTQSQRDGRQWWLGHVLPPAGPISGADGCMRPVGGRCRLMVLNPRSHAVRATVTVLHPDREATGFDFTIAAQDISVVDLIERRVLVGGQVCGLWLTAEMPVLPQLVTEYCTFWQQTADAIVSVAPYAGPLIDETRWVLADCYQGGPPAWHEQETLTLANPSDEPVEAHLRFVFRGRSGWAGQTVRIKPRQMAVVELWRQLPTIEGRDDGLPVRLIGDYAIHVTSDRPILPQVSRLARWRGFETVVGARSELGQPLRDEAAERQWILPGGLIVDRGVQPRDQDCHLTWALLFAHNLVDRPVRVRLTFHQADGRTTQAEPFEVAAGQTQLHWLHKPPFRDVHVPVDQPWSLVLEADGPVVGATTCAEFEMWSGQCPGAMSATHLLPGPVEAVGEQWLGLFEADAGPGHEQKLQQIFHVFNPGPRPATAVLHVVGQGENAVTQTLKIPVGGVTMVDSDAVDGLVAGKPYAVCVTADAPVATHAHWRSFTRGQTPTRAMAGQLGMPIALGGGGAGVRRRLH